MKFFKKYVDHHLIYHNYYNNINFLSIKLKNHSIKKIIFFIVMHVIGAEKDMLNAMETILSAVIVNLLMICNNLLICSKYVFTKIRNL